MLRFQKEILPTYRNAELGISIAHCSRYVFFDASGVRGDLCSDGTFAVAVIDSEVIYLRQQRAGVLYTQYEMISVSE